MPIYVFECTKCLQTIEIYDTYDSIKKTPPLHFTDICDAAPMTLVVNDSITIGRNTSTSAQRVKNALHDARNSLQLTKESLLKKR